MTDSDKQPLNRWLNDAPPFSELDESTRQWLSSTIDLVAFEAEQMIATHQPQQTLELWLILEGEVALDTTDGEALETRQAGEVFGHAIVFDDPEVGKVGYQTRAMSHVSLAHVPGEVVTQLMAQAPVVASFLSAQPADRLRTLLPTNTLRLSDLNLHPPMTGDPSMKIQQVASVMAAHRISALPLMADQRLIGIVTDRDLRSKVLAVGLDPKTEVASIMTPAPKTAHAHALIDDAMVTMMQAQIHHLPIVNDQDQLVGIVSAGDLLRTQSPHPLRLARDIGRAKDLTQLVGLSKHTPAVLTSLAKQGSEVTEVGRISSMLTDAFTQRLTGLAEHSLGPAPMPWCWVAFGSQARMEQGLVSDQDNGLVLATEPTAQQADYFQRFAKFVCDGLNGCGYVYCNGGVMAMGHWRMSLSAWQSTFDRWMREPDPQSIMNCSIFFDQRAICGDHGLVEQLQAHVLKQAKDASIFLRFLAAEAMRHTPALGLFNRFVQEHEGDEDKGINLKKRGVLPIVDLARVRALEGAITATHTETRLQEAAQLGIMNAGDADDLVHALRFIGNVRLRHQIKRFEAGLEPNHLVDPDELSRLHQRYLRSAFGIVRRAHHALASRYQL